MSNTLPLPGPALVPPEKPKTTIGVIFLTIFLDLVGFSIIFPLFPDMLETYLNPAGGAQGAAKWFLTVIEGLQSLAGLEGGATDENGIRMSTLVLFGGVLGSIYSFLQFISSSFWGKLSDRYGRRPILLCSVGGMIVSYFIWAISGNFTVFIISRVIGGFMGGNISTATAAVADITTARNRAKGMGVIGAAFGLGFIFGPAIGGILNHDISDKLSFLPGANPFSLVALTACALTIINWVWIYRRFLETLPPEKRGQGHSRTLNIMRIFGGDHPGVQRIKWVNFIFLTAFSGMEFTLTFMAVERFNFTPMQNAYMFIFVGFVIAMVQGGMVRRWAPKWGERKLALRGLVVVVPGLLLTGLSTNVPLLYVGLFFMAFGSAMVTPGLSALVSLYTPSDQQGEVVGQYRSLGALARAVGPIGGCLVYWRFSVELAYGSGSALIILALIFALALTQPNKDEIKDEIKAG